MTTRLLIWRHGRTEWNATDRIQGQTDVALDEVGIRQANQAATLLAGERPDVIVSSDLTRTRMTARALAEATGLPVTYDARLRERGFGPWEGLDSAGISASYAEEYAAWKRGLEPAVPGIEPAAQMLERIDAALREIADTHSGTVCVVTHGGAARRALSLLLELPDDLAWRLGPLGNCRWSELRHTARGWRLHGHNLGPATGAAGPSVAATATDVEPTAAERLSPTS